MGIQKRNDKYEIQVYDPAVKRKRYVGIRAKHSDAKKLFQDKTREFAANSPEHGRKVTCREYAATWLDLHHGQGTRRPSPTTLTHNEQMLRAFLADFGARLMDGGVTRGEALAWAKRRPHNARAVAAMFNDAIDDEACQANPFRNRRQEQSRGRQDIFPLTEDEVDRLAGLALEHWGRDGYGLVARAWVLFGAWVGSRPGETFTVEWSDLDFRGGLVRVTRVKGRKQTEWIVLPAAVQDAIRAMPPSDGLLFETVTGRPMDTKGALHYAWRPVREAFRATVTPARWAELLNGQSDKKSLDFYALRHYCASVIVDRGGNEYDCAQQLGNTPEVCRKTYIHGYRDRINDRNRARLQGENVVDINERRKATG